MSGKRNHIARKKLELKRWFITGSFVCLILSLPFTADAATVHTWDLQGDGNWSVAGNWNPAHAPNGAGDQARIDDDPDHDVTVYLNMSASVSGLELDIGDKLSINNGGSLSFIPDESANVPIVLNDGEIILSSTGGNTRLRSMNCSATLSGSGSVVLGGHLSNQLNATTGFAVINDINHTIRGGGTIFAAVTNDGEIIADNQILQISGHIGNANGIMSASGNGNILRLASGTHRITVTGGQIIPKDGTIELNQATLAGTTHGPGQTNVIGGSNFSGDIILEAGAILSINNGQTLSLLNSANITNNGTIIVNSTGGYTRLGASGSTATFTGIGSILMSGYASNQLNATPGFSIINDTTHTIRGGGTIYADVTNNGEIIADNQILQILGHIDNTNGIMSASGRGNTLRISYGSYHTTVTGGQIIPSDGVVELNGGILAGTTLGSGKTNVIAGGTLSGDTVLEYGAMLSINNGQTLSLVNNANITNNGTIIVNSTGSYTRLEASGSTATFTGTGSILMSGYASNQLNATTGFSFINEENHCIRGGATIGATIVNNGHIIADNQKLLFNSGIAGNGSISVADDCILDLRQNSETGHFYIREHADLLVANNLTVDVNGNFAFAQTDVSKWGWGGNCTLKMSGEGESMQPLEIGGEDLGAVPGGFSNNFNLENLNLEVPGTYVYLSDSIVNRTSLSDEALYVSNLVVNPDTTLNLNGLNLYTVVESEIHRVEAEEGDLFGGGIIINNSSGISEHNIEFEPSAPISFDFDVVGIGEESTVEEVRLRNDGDGYITISSVIFDGDDDFHFDDSSCMTTILGNDEECVMTIQFLPHAVGDRSATLTIQHNDPDEPEIIVSLSGIGVCRGDFDDDGDVDGLDLVTLVDDPGLLRLTVFGANLGRSDCD